MAAGFESLRGKTPEKKWHWNCAGALCTSNWRSQTPMLEYYSLRGIESNENLKIAYAKVLKNSNINWKKGVICSKHWSSGKRENLEDLPDLVCSPEYVERLENSNSSAKRAKKLVAAKRALDTKGTAAPKAKRRLLVRTQEGQVSQDVDSLDPCTGCEVKQNNIESELVSRLTEKEEEITKLQNQISELLKKQKTQEDKIGQIRSEMRRGQFSYSTIKERQNKFFDLTGLTVAEFDCLFECIDPYTHLLHYPNCTSGGLVTKNRKMDQRTELMTFLTVCRHSLHLKVMAWMTQSSEATISRVFVAWAVFLSTLFECLDLSPLPGFVDAFLPKVFRDAGFAETEALGDATETWIAQSENFDVNNITFSNYKNHTTGKTAVWIYPHGGLLCCSETYPGTITDHDITEQSGVLDKVNKGKLVLTDKGFDIVELCLKKGILHNRPPMKFDLQYEQTDISRNFDIATLRIYNENYIGRIRDWTILNSCWPMTRIDILGYCFKVFAHIVNILKTPVGPSET